MEIYVEKISAIVDTEEKLERIVCELIENGLGPHDISIQGSAHAIQKRYGTSIIQPDQIQESINPPTKEPFLQDDYAWLLGFSFSIPMFICIVVGVFIIGDVRSYHDNITYGILGALVGSILGWIIFNKVKKYRYYKIKQQEYAGGFVIWISVVDMHQATKVKDILEANKVRHIVEK
jgi:hypothetical protein